MGGGGHAAETWLELSTPDLLIEAVYSEVITSILLGSGCVISQFATLPLILYHKLTQSSHTSSVYRVERA